MERVIELQEKFVERLDNEIEKIALMQPSSLYKPVKYILNIGGKRLRPAMVLLANELFGGDEENAMRAALSVEIFHNFTLLHDDIMDNAEVRRNKPTVHVEYDVNTAILSGDAMSILAYDYLLKCDCDNIMPIIRLFTQTAVEVCEGQQYDMDFSFRDDVTEEEYIEMIRLKTGVLLASCFKTGALVAKAPNVDADLMYDFGMSLGIGFQLQDDYLDTFGTQDTFGKRIGGDILCNKQTYLLISALKHADEESASELKAWLAKKDYDEEEKIAAVKAIYNKTGVKELSKRIINQYYEQAMDCLSKIQLDEDKKKVLLDLAETIVNRER